jgi:formiminotetrahydrofolate cyclodeaminase
MARLTDLTLIDLLSAFRSTEPTPGGGSAAALAGAVGASLLAMVSGLPKPRATTEEDIERLATAQLQCSRLGDRLAVLVDRDSEAYDMVIAAYRLPRGTDAEKQARTGAIQLALRSAIDVPLEVMRTCADAVEQGVVVTELGNRNAASDVQVGLELLLAGLRGARLNVEVNLGMVKDAAYVALVGEELSRLTAAAERDADAAREKARSAALQ